MNHVVRLGMVVGVLGLLPGTATASTITPATAFASGNQTSDAQVVAAASLACGCTLTEEYFQIVDGAEGGPLATSYETTFSPTGAAKTSFTIAYSGGSFVGPTAWLIVKDGVNFPAWYLFNMTDLGWSGTDTIDGSGFWTTSTEGIARVDLFGPASVPESTVPEPATLLLLGTGLGAVAARRRLKKRA